MATKRKPTTKKEKSTTAPEGTGSTKAAGFRKLRINVIQEDIDQGERYGSQSCPVWYALRRTVPKCLWAVNVSYCHDITNDHFYDFLTGTQAKLRGYDETGKMEPFSFDLMRFSWV